MMEKMRDVDKLMSIFDFEGCDAVQLPKGETARVMLVYDRKENIRDFKILNPRMTEDTKEKIRSWLEKNTYDWDMFPHAL